MPRVTYHILVDHDGWYVGLNEKRFGPCKTELLAVGAAVSAAMKAAAEGIETEVLVDRPSDNLRRVLTPDVSRVSSSVVSARGSDAPTLGGYTVADHRSQ